MPLNFAEVWLNRVITLLSSATNAPFLAGIPELDTPVIAVGTGDMSESNIIHIPASFFEPSVLINNTTYPIAIEPYGDQEFTLQLDKYQSLATSITDDQIIGAAYNKIDRATQAHRDAITKKKYARAIYNLAPASNLANTPVLVTTGPLVNGRRRLIYEDLVSLKAAYDAIDTPMDGRRLVLCFDHWNDLLLDDSNYNKGLINFAAGSVVPVIAGFQLYQYINNPFYTVSTKVRAPYGSAFNASTQTYASVSFYTPNVAMKTGLTKMYLKPAVEDPQNQMNLMNFRHYYLCLPIQNKYIAAIISNNV